RVLFAQHRGGGLERDAKIDGLAVGDAALDAPGTIRQGAHLAGFHAERIVVLQTGQQDAAEAGADVETFRGGAGSTWLWPARLRVGRRPVRPSRAARRGPRLQ